MGHGEPGTVHLSSWELGELPFSTPKLGEFGNMDDI